MSEVLDPKVGRLVIVGASLAGLKAAEAARGMGFDGQIIMIGDESHLPYDRPPLSKQFFEADGELAYFRDDTYYASDLRATMMLGRPATALDTGRKVVIVGDSEEISYDALIIASGAHPRELAGLTGDQDVVAMRSADDALAIRTAIEAGRDITVIGAGFIGAEVASAARKNGNSVTIIESTLFPLERAVGRQMGALLSDMHRRNGTDLRVGVTVADVRRSESGIESLILSDGVELETDLILVSIGVVPATSWLHDSDVELNPDGGVVCNEFLETSVPGIFAAGDLAFFPNGVMDQSMRLEHWTSANEEGSIAGKNAVASEKTAYQTVPYVWSDWYGNRIQFAGHAGTEEPYVVSGSLSDDKFVALYRQGERVIGALAVNEPSKIMKDRRRIALRTSWANALEVYADANNSRSESQVAPGSLR